MGGRGFPTKFELYDADNRLITTMRGVAVEEIGTHRDHDARMAGMRG